VFRAVFPYWGRRAAVVAGVLLAVAAIGVGAYFLVDALGGNGEEKSPAPAPRIVIHPQPQQQPEATQDLGFPAFATKNTTRVSGADPIADAAGVALAVFPSTGGVEGPAAVTLVRSDDWPGGIAAASLVAQPIRAPILITSTDTIPSLTQDALRALAPAGSAETGGKQVFRIGSAPELAGQRTEHVKGSNPAQIAAAVDKLRLELTGDQPKEVLLASSGKPEFAMPAAAWAARSGDPVLFLQKNAAPKPTLAALKRHEGVPVFVLGPPSVISDKALKEVAKVAPDVQRIGAEDPVQNAIAFARCLPCGSFGWDINDPGHGFVIASDARPLDAAAAAPLSASGDWGPLLLTDNASEVPAALRAYLLDVKPGYIEDPTRAVYNHLWLIGDQDAISTDVQAQVDDLAEVAQVSSGTGTTTVGPPGTAKNEGSTPPKKP
jgi:putative cell wall binding repeat protein